MDGILLVNKPAGITSFDAVRQCRRIYHEKKTGHTGTLDPGAEGLMIILMGKYTKLIPYCVKNQKHYIAHLEKLYLLSDVEHLYKNP
jgi:tRNA pseudouridine55 synthase